MIYSKLAHLFSVYGYFVYLGVDKKVDFSQSLQSLIFTHLFEMQHFYRKQ